MLLAGKYAYMSHLRTLARRLPPSPTPLPESLGLINSPLRVGEWRALLSSHPDEEFREYLLCGMVEGFRIGFDYTKECKSAKRNMLSAMQNPSVVGEYLAKEVALGRIVGPLEPGTLNIRSVQVNRFGVIPKPHQPGRWRLIVDLSYPRDNSVNDGIEPELCSLSYASIDDAVEMVLKKGRGTRLAKIDLESAYRIVPVHPQDRLLLGMRWEGKVYLDTALPFGLRSAPKIFTALADGLIWIMIKQGIRSVLHYLDDYLFAGDPGTSECAEALQLALNLCERLGVPVAEKKVEGPVTSLVFLGILVDTEAGELRLPEEKLARLRALITQWQHKKACTKRELLSLIGQLPGKVNIAADCLSRDNLPQFLQQVPTASPHPTTLPVELLNALIHHRPDWTSKNWKVWFDTILTKV